MTVPAFARATCHLTFPPPRTLADMRALVDARARAFARERQLDGRFELVWSGLAVEPVEADGGHLGVLLQRVVRDLGLDPPPLVPSTGTSDLRHIVNAGIPGLLYGPGRGDHPHRPDERYQLDDLATMIAVFVDLAVAWCGRPG